MFEHLVVIVDGSPTSEYAVGASITVARELGSTITFCLTLDPILREHETGMMPFAELAYGMKERLLEAAIAQAERGGIHDARGVIINDEPARGVVATAHGHDADVIMMGLAPRTGILRPFMRNLAEAVIAETTIPLSIVRRPARGYLTHRILVPIVDDALGRIAVNEAIRMALRFKSVLVFCSLAGTSDLRAAEAAVAYGLAAATERGVTAETLVVGNAGTISTAIVCDADVHGCDALVMATHARQGLPRIIEGSVTQAVVERSDVPVLVVRAPFT